MKKKFTVADIMPCLPLCPDEQVKGLHTQVMGALWVEQNAMQQVDGDICGGVVTRLQ